MDVVNGFVAHLYAKKGADFSTKKYLLFLVIFMGDSHLGANPIRIRLVLHKLR